ncbi:cation transporter/ATPase, amino-terminal protein [Ceratobasidium sp. AG-Ba]|nr:cation transporter/ATPase, amino-terminal protein [Ceratobasidium sp. AG-Ba]
MDQRTKGMPWFQKLCHFTQGTSVISQWTGKEAKALGRTLLSTVAGHEKPKLVKAVKSVVDFMARAHKHEVSKRNLEAMNNDILDLDWSKIVFVDVDLDELLSHEDQFNNFVKFHALTHYPYLISQLGAPEGFNTKITKRLHIDFVKIPWSTTNHVNATQQMIACLCNREAWALLCAYMHNSRLILDPRFEDPGANAEEDEEDGPAVAVDGGNG